MKNQEINNQTTLFRFVTLRSAELTKKENQDKRFVFHPDNQTGIFFDAVNDKESNTTKWNAMRSASENFSAFQDEQEIENINPVFFKLADWIARNKSTLDPLTLAEKCNGLDPLDLKPESLELKSKRTLSESNLWDNLFHQVVTQKSFYVKEAIIQLLVLNNILKNKTVFIGKEFDAEIAKALVLSKVVLPTKLFEEEITENTFEKAKKREQETKEKHDFVPQELIIAQNIAQAKLKLTLMEQAKTELQKVEKSSKKENQKQFEHAQKEYQKRIKPTLDAYKKEYIQAKFKLETAAQTNKDINTNLIEIDYPELPEFEFETQKNDYREIQKKLPILSESIDFDTVETFEEIYQDIDNQVATAHQTIIENTVFHNPYTAFGDVILPISSEANVGNFYFRIEFRKGKTPKIADITFSLPNNSYTVQSVFSEAERYDGTIVQSTLTGAQLTVVKTGNTITIFNVGAYEIDYSDDDVLELLQFKIEINLSPKLKLRFEKDSMTFNTPTLGNLVVVKSIDNPTENPKDFAPQGFAPQGFGYRQLGIADYKKVVSKICKYEVGEVAHIENVMARELREKSTTKFHQTQVIETESTEIETEKVNDTTSAERFEMQTEIAKLMQEQKQFAAHVDVNSSWGNTTIDAGASYASNVSKEESNRQAVNQAKEITQRAMERIVSRVKNEKTVKTTDEFTEVNTHIFDNTESGEHVSGVFRFINAIYKNQIYNYGKRLMYEFMIPQPSKLHHLGMSLNQNSKTTTIDKPIDPRTTGYTDFTKINEYNYQLLASKYNAEVEVCPETYINLSQSFLKEDWLNDGRWHKSGEFAIKIPEKYAVDTVKGYFDPMNGNHSATWNNMSGVIYIGTKRIVIPNRTAEMPILASNFDTEIKNEVKITMTTYDIATYNFNLIVKCKLTDGAKVEWQKKTFEAILKGYYSQLAEYNQSIAEAKATGIQILDSNPLFYRQIEQNVLRQNCISYLLDHSTNANNYKQFGLPMFNTNATTFTNFQVNLDQKMDNYGSFAKFIEQAFEWNLMSYSFYPYYWANKDDWKHLYQFESNDAIFRSFMQSGMARVIVTVKPGFEDAVMYYMAFGEIWKGGQMPVLGNPLYLSIVDELKEQEYAVEETWTTTLPTNLIALQKSGVSVDATGLPTLDTCEAQSTKKLVTNSAKLGIGTTENDTKLANRVTKIESRMIENIDINDGKISLTTKGKNRQVVAQISTEDLKRELQ